MDRAGGITLVEPEPTPTDPVPPQKPASRRGLLHYARRLALLLTLVYVGLCAVLYALQTRLIFPGSDTQGAAEAVVRPGPDAELITLKTAAGDRVVALFGRALNADGSPRPDAHSCPSLLFFYGNGMCLRSAESEFDSFRRLGANVLIPEYVGYGMSEGEPGEAGCYATADAAYGHLVGRPDVDPSRIVAAGWSLGGAVAIDLAARREVAGLAVFSTFTRLAVLAKRVFPFLPASLLLAHRFDSIDKIGRVTCPTLIGHGLRDRVVPHEMSDELADAAGGPVSRYTIEGADHNDFFETEPRTTRAKLLDLLGAVR